MVTVKVTTQCGNSWSTDINCSFEQAQQYFMGKIFTKHDETQMLPVISVVQC